MRRKLVFLVIIVIFIVAGFFLYRLIRGTPARLGVLKVTTSPSTTIFLDNRHLGRVPYEDKVPEGEYTVKLVPETATEPVISWQGKIKIVRNLLTYINADLADSEFSSSVDILWLEKIPSKSSELSVITNPDGATVSLDGDVKGASPIVVADVVPGDHTVTIVSPGFLPRTLKIKTTSGYKLLANIKLALAPGGTQISPTQSVASQSATPTVKPGARVSPQTSPSPTASVSSTPKTTADPPKPFALIKDTPTGFLRVRMEPTTAATEAAKVYPGDKFTIFDTKSGWYQIEYDGTNKGWISSQYATKVE